MYSFDAATQVLRILSLNEEAIFFQNRVPSQAQEATSIRKKLDNKTR